MAAQILNTALGIWLMMSSHVLGYGGAGRTNEQIVGPVVATFACCAIWQVLRPWRWVNLPLGAWLVVAPFVLGLSREATINGVVTGTSIAALSLVRGRITKRYAGGWREVWSNKARPNAG